MHFRLFNNNVQLGGVSYNFTQCAFMLSATGYYTHTRVTIMRAKKTRIITANWGVK